jgi:hypothetical protein
LPDGQQVRRRFAGSNSVLDVTNFVRNSCAAVSSPHIAMRLVATFPRKVLEPAEASLQSLNVVSGSALIAEKVVS